MTEAEKLVEEVAAILMGCVNAPEAEIYSAARAACEVMALRCAEKADKWSKDPGTISPPSLNGPVHASMVADCIANDIRTLAASIKDASA